MQLVTIVLYIAALVAMVALVVRFIIQGALFIYSALSGAPYVATRADIDAILTAVPISANTRMLEVGCGDGRVARRAVELLRVRALGIDIDPLLIWRAKRARKSIPPTKLDYQVANIHDTDTSSYHVFYLFLLPSLLQKTVDKIIADRSTKKPLLIISHAFKIASIAQFLIHTEKGRPYNTYYYQLK